MKPQSSLSPLRCPADAISVPCCFPRIPTPKTRGTTVLGTAALPEAGHGRGWGCGQVWVLSGTPEKVGWGSGHARAGLSSPLCLLSAEREPKREQSKSGFGRACAAVGGGG